MTFPTPAQHPPSCHACKGTGWMEAPEVPYKARAAGQSYDGSYTMHTPCTNDWKHDDPFHDDDGLSTTPLDRSDPTEAARAQRAFARGYAAALAERNQQ